MLLAFDLGRSWDHFLDAARAFGNHFAEINWAGIAIAFAFYLGMLLARGRSWQKTLEAAYPENKVRFDQIAAAYIAGAGLNSFIPARVGDVVKIFLAKHSIRGSTYPTITSSFFVQSVFDTTVGLLVLAYAITQGLLPKPPELPDLPAFDIAFWAEHPRFLIFFLTVARDRPDRRLRDHGRRAEKFWDRVKQGARSSSPTSAATCARSPPGRPSPGSPASPRSGSSSRPSTSAARSRTCCW